MEADEVIYNLVGLSLLIPAFIVIIISVFASGLFLRSFRRGGGCGSMSLLIAAVSTVVLVIAESQDVSVAKTDSDIASTYDYTRPAWLLVVCLYASGACLVVTQHNRGEQAEDTKPDNVPS